MAKYPPIPYSENYLFQLGDYIIQTPIRPKQNINTKWVNLNTDGLMTIRDGFGSDGTSFLETKLKWIPIWGKKIINLLRKGSFVHDGFYYLFKMDALILSFRPQVDDFAFELWIDSGVPEWFAKLCRRELRKFGGSAALPENMNPILYAE